MAMQLARAALERAAHDQPHHQLDTFRARLAQIFDVRLGAQPLRVAGQVVEELHVPGFVDQPRTRALALVAPAAGPPELPIEILRDAFAGARDRLSQEPAEIDRGRRLGEIGTAQCGETGCTYGSGSLVAVAVTVQKDEIR